MDRCLLPMLVMNNMQRIRAVVRFGIMDLIAVRRSWRRCFRLGFEVVNDTSIASSPVSWSCEFGC